MKMKNIAALVMLTFLAVTGYYVGAAVAMGHNPSEKQTEPSGVLVVEEEYGVVATPDNQKTQSTSAHDGQNNDKNHQMKNSNSDNGAMVVEEVDEMETVE